MSGNKSTEGRKSWTVSQMLRGERRSTNMEEKEEGQPSKDAE